jgi:hypothetical protein
LEIAQGGLVKDALIKADFVEVASKEIPGVVFLSGVVEGVLVETRA